MNDIDDPLFAMILRFVVAEADSDLPHEACMRLQVALIQDHIAAFPAEEREAHAMAWVERLSSANYVRASLALLQEHKDRLKVTRIREESRPSL